MVRVYPEDEQINNHEMLIRLVHKRACSKSRENNHYCFQISLKYIPVRRMHQNEKNQDEVSMGISATQNFQDGNFQLHQFSSVTSNKLNAKKKIKLHDIKCLKKIYMEIDSLPEKISNTELIKSLKKIASLCGGEGGLSFNDRHDPDSYCIRNRYGYKKRNQSNKVNNNQATRIDFEMLYRIKALAEHDLLQLDSIQDEILNELHILSQKIACILHTEIRQESWISERISFDIGSISKGNENDMLNLKKIVDSHYPALIKARLTQEAEEMSRIEIKDKISVYAVVRKFVIIGELLHELKNIKTGSGSVKKQNMMSLGDRFNDLRNRSIHFNLHISLLLLLSSKEGAIQETIQEISTNFYRLLCNSSNLEDVVEDVQSLKACKEKLDFLFELLEPNKIKKM